MRLRHHGTKLRAWAPLWAALVGALALAPGGARAQASRAETTRAGAGGRRAAEEPAVQAGRSDQEAAVALYLRARTLYDQGQYREAAEDLERARALDPTSPTLAYNIARVYELLGELQLSIDSYRRHLELLPEDTPGEEREQIESAIRRLEGALASGQVQNDEAEGPRSRVVIEHEPGVADELFWGVLIGGAGVLVAGFALGGAALAVHSDATGIVYDGRPPGEVEQARDSAFGTAQSLGITTDIMVATGAAAMLAGTLLYFLRDREVVREEPIPEGGSEGEPGEGAGGEGGASGPSVRLELIPSFGLLSSGFLSSNARGGGLAGGLSLEGSWQ